MNQRLMRALLAGLLSLVLVALSPLAGLQAATPALRLDAARAKGSVAIPINEQPFYPDLLLIQEQWGNAPLNRVVGDSPRETLLNFYAVMARVNQLLHRTALEAKRDPGMGWSAAARHKITEAEQLFDLAVQALDADVFPESIRKDMADEAALQLKEVLDFVFTHSTVPIQIPDAAGLKAYNEQRSRSSESWSLPNTSITLASPTKDASDDPGFLFAGNTVRDIGRMYEQIQDRVVVKQPFASSGFYNS